MSFSRLTQRTAQFTQGIPHTSGVPRGGLGCSTHPPNSEGPPKSCQTQPDCENYYKLLNLGRQHTEMFGKKIAASSMLHQAKIAYYALDAAILFAISIGPAVAKAT